MTKDSTARAPTVSHILGEMTWLLTQSPLHRAMTIGDLEWLIMPPLIHRQFYIFRDGSQTVGLALWARCGPEAEAKLERGMIEPENRLTPEEWVAGETLWLVDLIAPFADQQNRHREIMMADLISGPLSGREFKFHITDPASGERTVQTVAADAGSRLTEAIENALEADRRG
ncbi:MAG TPA: toxin-activating lysine-acyltransferase [Propylenella sp.]|nr:toxin-activating lysine-acyltransferase [Propylenella sp.]